MDNKFIKIVGRDLFLINQKLLGLPKAQLWIGTPDGPKHDDDELIAMHREEDKKANSIRGIEAQDIRESEKFPGWYEIDTSRWPADTYRLMIHSRANVQAPNGTKLDPRMRDLQYSWPNFDDEYIISLPVDQQIFLYLEPNERGFCIRLKITPEREILPAGTGQDWVPFWPEISKKVKEHFEKIKKTS